MNLATAIPKERFTLDQRTLYRLMSDISEACYCAGWMNGNEYRLWSAITDPTDDRNYGRGEISDEEIADLKTLVERTGGWIVWGDDDDGLHIDDWGPYFIPIDEWKAKYAYETEGHQQGTPK